MRGRLRRARLNRPAKNQARPMAVSEVLWLEAFLADRNRALPDRYAAGCYLFAIFSCARLGDLKLVTEACLDFRDESDFGFIEVISLSHKSRAYGNALGLRMPLIAPIKGAGARCWGRETAEWHLESNSPSHSPHQRFLFQCVDRVRQMVRMG